MINQKGQGDIMVKSEATKDMPNMELLGIQENLKNSDYTEIERFRESFDADEMGFVGLREGI
jgi:hypothetical protein